MRRLMHALAWPLIPIIKGEMVHGCTIPECSMLAMNALKCLFACS